jgi:hypothetical protein
LDRCVDYDRTPSIPRGLADDVAADHDDQLSLTCIRCAAGCGRIIATLTTSGLFERLTTVLEDLTDGRLRDLVEAAYDLIIRSEALPDPARRRRCAEQFMVEAVQAYEATDAVSLLTIHCSKGLKYHAHRHASSVPG